MATAKATKSAVEAASTAAAYWRAAGMTYFGYAKRCAVLVRKCQKEPFKSQSLGREKVHYKVSLWADGEQQKGEHRGGVEATGK